MFTASCKFPQLYSYDMKITSIIMQTYSNFLHAWHALSYPVASYNPGFILIRNGSSPCTKCSIQGTTLHNYVYSCYVLNNRFVYIVMTAGCRWNMQEELTNCISTCRPAVCTKIFFLKWSIVLYSWWILLLCGWQTFFLQDCAVPCM